MDAEGSDSIRPVPTGEGRWLRVVALTLAAVVLLLHVAAFSRLSDRPLHYDETEYLHASWLMAAGEQVYVDFFEDHPPHLFLLLNSVMPDAPEGELQRIDVRRWTHRARLAAGIGGLLAVVAAMLVAWRITTSPAAATIAGAILLAGPQVWTRGLADVRAEPFTLALFWWGVVLMLWRSDLTFATAVRRGIGIGLIVVVALWNPKWPLVSLTLGVVYLSFLWRSVRSRPRLLPAAIVPALALFAAGLGPIVATATLRHYLFFNFVLKSLQLSTFSHSLWMEESFRRNPLWTTTDPLIRWWWIAVAGALVIAALFVGKARSSWTWIVPSRAWIAIALLAASAMEVRFVYSYPHIWAQYVVMLAFCAAIVYSMLPGAAAVLVSGLTGRDDDQRRLRTFFAATALLTMTAVSTTMLTRFVLAAEPNSPRWNSFWKRQLDLQQSVPAGGTVWISPPRHPIAAYDASYYWYSFQEAVPNAVEYARRHPNGFLPAIAAADMPPCRLVREGDRRLTLIEIGPWLAGLGTCECAETAVRERRVEPTLHFGIFTPRVAGLAESGPERMPRWYFESRSVWPDLCRWDTFVADEREFEAAVRSRGKQSGG